MTKVTAAQITAFTNNKPVDSAAIADAVNLATAKYKIESLRQVRYFVAQAAHETLGFTKWVEDLYYTTPERLVAVFPSRISMVKTAGKALASDLIKNPQAVANTIYQNRYGNGDYASGDGYSYRGRGGFHLTFKDNYRAYSKATYGDDRIVRNPDLVALPADAMTSAAWFFSTNGCLALADKDEFTKVTSVINGAKDQQLVEQVRVRLPLLNLANRVIT